MYRRVIQQVRSKLPSRYESYLLYYRLTALGVVLHEFAHEMLARQRGLEIHEVEYFTLKSDRLGYVIHEAPRTYLDLFFVSVAPFIINTLFGLAAFVSVGLYVDLFGLWSLNLYGILGIIGIVIFLWLGISATQHAFPSVTDIGNIYQGTTYLWGNSMVPVVQPLFLFTMKRHWAIYVCLYPFWLVLRFFQLLIFTVFHPFALITMPAVVTLDILDRTTKYGSNTAYSIGVIYVSYRVTEVLSSPASTLINFFF